MGKQDHALIAERSDLVTHGKIISQKEVLVKSGIFGVIEEIYVHMGDTVNVIR
jgi:multidrug efflux pump subunit AcrA (membrane-fusion protein)